MLVQVCRCFTLAGSCASAKSRSRPGPECRTTVDGLFLPFRTKKAVPAQIVIIEEAAEVLEPHVIASLAFTTEHLILIGAHSVL